MNESIFTIIKHFPGNVLKTDKPKRLNMTTEVLFDSQIDFYLPYKRATLQELNDFFYPNQYVTQIYLNVANFFRKKLYIRSLHKKWSFPLKNFFSKCDQIHSFLWIWSQLLKKSLMENFIFCAVDVWQAPKYTPTTWKFLVKCLL